MKLKKYFLLQLFAEEGAQEGATGGGQTDSGQTEDKTKEQEGQKSPTKYTDDDVDKILSQKFAEWQSKKQKEIDEAKRLAGMSAQEKAELENKTIREQLEQLMNERKLTEMSKTARSILSEKNINVNDELLSMLVSDDADKTKKTIDSFVGMFQEAVKKEVAEALKGNVPKTGSSSTYTKEQILAIKDRNERQKLIRENMSLFN